MERTRLNLGLWYSKVDFGLSTSGRPRDCAEGLGKQWQIHPESRAGRYHCSKTGWRHGQFSDSSAGKRTILLDPRLRKLVSFDTISCPKSLPSKAGMPQ